MWAPRGGAYERTPLRNRTADDEDEEAAVVVAEEEAAAVGVDGVHHHRASAMLSLARDLVTGFPAIVEAMESGLLDERTAGMLVRQMRTVDPSVLDAVHRLVVDWLLDSIESGERSGAAVSGSAEHTTASMDSFAGLMSSPCGSGVDPCAALLAWVRDAEEEEELYSEDED